ncbi:hypothetical protein HYZ99_03170 [Candidatus Peregrinibacteria bacterium]|nr:hypothetical protein [Candidatus Peregrinibacteria bacterium]
MRKLSCTLCGLSVILGACQGSVVDYSRLDDVVLGEDVPDGEYFDCERFETDEQCDIAYAQYEEGYSFGLQLADDYDPSKDEEWLYNQCLALSQFKREGCLDAVGWQGSAPQ